MAHGLPFHNGLLEIGMVAPGSLAERAGLEVGDQVSSINGKPVVEYGPDDLSQVFGGEDPVRMEVRRNGDG